jgi:hypothetical protein
MKATQSSCLPAKVEICLQLEIASRDMRNCLSKKSTDTKNIYLAHTLQNNTKKISSSCAEFRWCSWNAHPPTNPSTNPQLVPQENTKRKESNKFALISHPLQVFVHNFTSVIFCENTPRIPKKTSSGIPSTVKWNNNNIICYSSLNARLDTAQKHIP